MPPAEEPPGPPDRPQPGPVADQPLGYDATGTTGATNATNATGTTDATGATGGADGPREVDEAAGEPITRRRRPRRSRLPAVLAVVGFVLLAAIGVVVGIATRDDDSGTPGDGGATSSTEPSDEAALTCPSGRWPAIVQGQPERMTEDPATGYYVWNDAFGWHVRVIDDAATPGRYTGEVVSTTNLTSSEVVPEGAGEVRVSGNTLTFDVPGGADPRGFDVAVGGCAATTVRFTLNDANGPVPESQVFVGINSTAVSNPLIVQRQG